MQLHYNFLLASVILTFILGCRQSRITEPIDDSLPPAAPSGLRVYAARDGQIGIEWRPNSEYDLIGYNIYRSINKPNRFVLLNFTRNTFFIDDSLEYDTTYYYRISAIDKLKRESPKSDYVSATPKNLYPPLRPVKLNINARNWVNNTSINLYWSPSSDTDIKGYEIYRSKIPNFETDSLHYLDFTTKTFYFDKKGVQLLTDYYYKIKAVDKGGLKSLSTQEVNDAILNLPLLIFPSNNSSLRTLTEFRFKTVSRPARYKLVIQANEFYGTIKEIDFTSNLTDQEIKIDAAGLYLEQYKTYWWRVFTYTKSGTDPNSISELFSFTFIPR